MGEKDKKLMQLAFEILGVNTKTALAVALGYSKTEPNNWKNGFSETNKRKIKEAIEKAFKDKKIKSNDLLHQRYIDIFVPVEIEDEKATDITQDIQNIQNKNLAKIVLQNKKHNRFDSLEDLMDDFLDIASTLKKSNFTDDEIVEIYCTLLEYDNYDDLADDINSFIKLYGSVSGR